MKINKPPLNEENFSNEKLCFLEEQSIHRVPFFQTHDTMMEGEKEEKEGKKNNTVETSCIARFKLYIHVISYENSENGKGHQE